MTPDGEVCYRQGDRETRLHARFVLANVTPAVLASLLGEPAPELAEGSQVKVNLMLRRLPRLRDARVTPEQAFGGTFHINETWSQLDSAHAAAAAGAIPDPLPCEIYCHSLTDPSILSPRPARVRGSDADGVRPARPHAVQRAQHADVMRQRLTDAVLASLNSVLAEPVQDVLMHDAQGRPCIEAKTTVDLEGILGNDGGNIFHGALDWPFVADDEPLETRRSDGAWRLPTTGSSCAGRVHAGVGRCRGSVATTRRWPSSPRISTAD